MLLKVLGIITEYNRFHNGHKYHIEKSKEITGADYVVLVMSGSFTQTGNIALLNKFERAKLACKYGVDLVIELPTIYATASAEYFAKGAINILNSLGIIDYICFGTEEKNIDNLKDISNTLIENEDKIFEQIKIELKEGITFPKAREIAISSIFSDLNKSSYIDILSKPNNILGLEYLKALNHLNSDIEAFLIQRDTSSSHSDINISNNNKIFTSATSIRNKLKEDINYDLSNYVPEHTNTLLKTSTLCFNENIFQLLKYKISSTSKEELSNIKTKRYTETKIKRILLNILLNITKDFFKQNQDNNISYAHILSMTENGKLLLSEMSKKSKLNIFTSINDKTFNNEKTDKKVIDSLKLDIMATNIQLGISGDILNLDYTNKLF